MLTRTGAALIAAGDLAPAMAKTDMATSSQTEQTKSLIPGFAQVLESSIETAGHTGTSHGSKFVIPAKLRGAPSSEPASTSVNWTLAQSQQPLVPAQPANAYALVPSAIATPMPVNANASETPSDVSSPADLTSLTTFAAPVEDIFSGQIPGLPSALQSAPSLTCSATATSTVSSASSSAPRQSSASSVDGTAAAALPTQTTQGPIISTLDELNVSPTPAISNSSAAKTSAADTATPFATPFAAQQPLSSQRGTVPQGAPANFTGATVSGATGAPAREANVSETTSGIPNTQVAPPQIPQSAASDSSTAPADTQKQHQISWSPNPTASTWQTSQTTSADSAIAPSATQYQQQAAVSSPASASATNEDSTTQGSGTLGSQPGVSFINSTISFSDATPSDAATGDATVSAQVTADPATADEPSTFAVPQTGRTSSETAMVADTWTKKSSQPLVSAASLPSSAGSAKSGKQQTVASGAGWTSSALQTAASTVASSGADPGARQQKAPVGNSSAKTKSDVSATAPTAIPHPVATSNATTTGTSKTQVATTPTPISTSPLSEAIWSIPTLAGNSTTLTSLKQSAANLATEDSAVPNPPGKTSADSSTSSDQSADSGSDDNSRPTISQTTVFATPAGVFAPVTVPSNMSVSTQTISLASALKQDLSVAANGSTSTGHNDAASDTQLPSAVAMHRTAEAAELSAGLQAWNGGDNAQTRMVQSARLTGNLGSSEMNVSLRTEGLGGVELRTHVTGDTVGASINVERHDAHAMLSNDLGSLHQALNDRQLRVGDVKVFQGAFGFGATAADQDSSQRREMAPQQQQSTNWTSGPSSSFAGATATADKSDTNRFFDSNGRLSVRA